MIPLRWRGKKFLPQRSKTPFHLRDIVDEGLFTAVALRKRRQQSKATKGSAADKATSSKIPPEKKTSPAGRASWRPRLLEAAVNAPRHLTPRGKDVSRELPTKPPMNPVTGGTNQQAPPPPKTSPTSQKTLSKTPDQDSPVLQAGDFPPLTDAGALRRPTKKTATQRDTRFVSGKASEWRDGSQGRVDNNIPAREGHLCRTETKRLKGHATAKCKE
ncbi:hypothetical protein MTO96_052047 [Rhipicephalus appendiculatus]